MDRRFLILLAAIGLYLYTRPRKAKADGSTTTPGRWIMVDGKCYDMQSDALIECPAEALPGEALAGEALAGEQLDAFAGFGGESLTSGADSWTADADSWTAD